MLSKLFILLAIIVLAYGQINQASVDQTRPVTTSFDSIVVNGLFDVILSQIKDKSQPRVVVTAPPYAQQQVTVEVLNNDTLTIAIEGHISLFNQIELHIYYKAPLRQYITRGAGNVKTDENGIVGDDKEKFTIIQEGTGNLALYLNVTEFAADLSGTGDNRFWGQVRGTAFFNVNGVGDVNALNLLAKTAKVLSSGISTVRVAASDDVEIEVTGVSTVYYRLPKGKKPTKAVSWGLGQVVPVL